MPRGVKRDKATRIKEELEKVISSLEKSQETVRDLQVRKKELEQEIRMCQQGEVLDFFEQSGLSFEDLRKLVATHQGQAI